MGVEERTHDVEMITKLIMGKVERRPGKAQREPVLGHGFHQQM